MYLWCILDIWVVWISRTFLRFKFSRVKGLSVLACNMKLVENLVGAIFARMLISRKISLSSRVGDTPARLLRNRSWSESSPRITRITAGDEPARARWRTISAINARARDNAPIETETTARKAKEPRERTSLGDFRVPAYFVDLSVL